MRGRRIRLVVRLRLLRSDRLRGPLAAGSVGRVSWGSPRCSEPQNTIPVNPPSITQWVPVAQINPPWRKCVPPSYIRVGRTMNDPAIMLPSLATKCRRQTWQNATRACDRDAFIAAIHSPTARASFSAGSSRAEAKPARPSIHLSTSTCWGRSGRPATFRGRPFGLRWCWRRGDGRVKRDAGISAPMAKKSAGVSGTSPTFSPMRTCSPSSAKIERSSAICSRDKPSACRPDVSIRAGSCDAGSMNGRSARHRLAFQVR